MSKEKIIIADDHIFVLKGLSTFLAENGYEIMGEYKNGIPAFTGIMSNPPDFAVLDIDMPGMGGIELCKKIKMSNHKTKIVILTFHKEQNVFESAMENGALGYVLKEFAEDEILQCLQTIKTGKKYISKELISTLTFTENSHNTDVSHLSFSEKKVLTLIAQNKSGKEISDILFISYKTVEKHRSNIIKKLNLPKTKNALIDYAVKNRAVLE